MVETETVKCPHCGKSVPWTEDYPHKPFCSERCRLIDLGDWLSERHAIASDEKPADQDSEES